MNEATGAGGLVILNMVLVLLDWVSLLVTITFQVSTAAPVSGNVALIEVKLFTLTIVAEILL